MLREFLNKLLDNSLKLWDNNLNSSRLLLLSNSLSRLLHSLSRTTSSSAQILDNSSLNNSLSTHNSLPQLHRGLFHNSSQLLFLSELFQDLHLSHKELFHNQLQLLKDLFLNNSNLLLFQKFQSQRLLLEKMV